MNRFLVMVVIVLIPVVIITSSKEEKVFSNNTYIDKYSLDLLVDVSEEVKSEEVANPQVLISNNKDKSNPYYIDLEEYIIGVVAGEMPASFKMEALKAQAVASRTFAVNKMQNIKGYVLSTTINDQVYLNNEQMKNKWGKDFEYYYNRVKEAVEATKGEVITSDGDIISAYYFAISNGYTDDASVVFKENKSYLVSVDSKWDKNYASISAVRTITKNSFCQKLSLTTCNNIVVSNVVRSDSNYVRELVINSKKFTGLEIFNKLGLKSTDFAITQEGDNVKIKTLGFGHGVGMSQYGAQGMANEGYTYSDILKHYYKNTEIANI